MNLLLIQSIVLFKSEAQEALDHRASFHQEERRFPNRESNHNHYVQVWVPLHYHPGV